MAKKQLYMGIMSGTSLDGVDIALCAVDEKECTLLHAHTYPFGKKLKKKVLEAIAMKQTVQTFGSLNIELAKLYVRSIETFCSTYAIKKKKVRSIGLHGQTLWHQPHGKYPFSLQLGDAAYVAKHTSIDVAYDFRSGDVALGGEGAPFAPVFHRFVFAKEKKSVVINIGGMTNITFLGKTVQGWDIGCGNVLLDYFIGKVSDKKYDKNGHFAKKGTINQPLLELMLQDPYFLKKPPKSTGREYFNSQWLEEKLSCFYSLSPHDIQATLTELVAKTIAQAIKGYGVKSIIVCGGGAKNGYLMQRIAKNTKVKVVSSDDLGVSSDFLEAMLFAWLAYKRDTQSKVNLKTVTGAKYNTILGAVYKA